jgi:hypothetical protein
MKLTITCCWVVSIAVMVAAPEPDLMSLAIVGEGGGVKKYYQPLLESKKSLPP